MSGFDINSEIKRVFNAALPKEPRFWKQQEIEKAILNFCPDTYEASEILDALMASLERRYEMEDAVDAYKAFRAKLEKGKR